MRQTIEEVIAEFDKTFITDGGTNLGYRNPENIRHFLRTTLTSRDQQIREVIENVVIKYAPYPEDEPKAKLVQDIYDELIKPTILSSLQEK